MRRPSGDRRYAVPEAWRRLACALGARGPATALDTIARDTRRLLLGTVARRLGVASDAFGTPPLAAPPDELAAALAPLDGLFGNAPVDPTLLADVYEALTGWTLVPAFDTPGGFTLRPHDTRRREGVYYTPAAVADAIVARALDGLSPPDGPLRVLDPAVGGGRFLVAVARATPAQLTGLDTDEEALDVSRALLAGTTPAPCLRAGDALSLLAPQPMVGAERLGPYDLVVGNPPYGAVADVSERAVLRASYPLLRGAYDRYRLFLEAALAHLAPGGRVALLLPTTWLTLAHAAPLRRHVLAGFRLLEITRFDADLFPDAIVDVAACHIERSPGHGCRALVRRVAADGTARSTEATQDDVLAAAHALVDVVGDDEPRRLAARLLATLPPASAEARFVCGAKPYQRGKGTPPQTDAEGRERCFEVPGPVDPTCRRLLTGRHVRPYRLDCPPDSWLRYGPWLAEPRTSVLFDAPLKLVGRQTGNRLIVAADDAQHVARDSTFLVVAAPHIPPERVRPTLLWLLAVLNDPLTTWLFRLADPDEATKPFPQVRVSSLRRLPVPPYSAQPPARRDAVVALVLRRAAATDAAEVESLEAALGAHVAAAYGLSPEEAAHVRALGSLRGGKPSPPCGLAARDALG